MCNFSRCARLLEVRPSLGQRSATAGEQHQGAIVHLSVDQAGLHRVRDRLLELLSRDAGRPADGIGPAPKPSGCCG